MDSLAKEDNIRDLRESLQNLPEDLDKTYDNALERIENQDARRRARADQVLTLISCARRPLKLEEMRQALSIRRGDTFLDSEALPKPESLISTCCGLVVVEDGSQIVKLVHYTTDEYFRRKLPRYRNPGAHGYLAGVLVTYLNFKTFTMSSLEIKIEDALNENDRLPETLALTEEEVKMTCLERFFKDNVLVIYSAENWGHHAREAFTSFGDRSTPSSITGSLENSKGDEIWSLKKLILDFLEKEDNILYANEIVHHLHKLQRIGDWDPYRGSTNVTGLQMAASFGILHLVEHYLNEGARIDASDSQGATALHKAFGNGHVEVVQVLLENGAAIGLQDRSGHDALLWAASRNRLSVLRLLLQNGSDPRVNASDGLGNSTLFYATSRGYAETLKLLAEYENESSRLDQSMRDALRLVAGRGDRGKVRFRMCYGMDWIISQRSLLMLIKEAARNGEVAVMKAMFQAGVDVRTPLPIGGHSLQDVAGSGHLKAVQSPIEEGNDLFLDGENSDPPLHGAIDNDEMESVTLFPKNGADVNARNAEGDTAFVYQGGIYDDAGRGRVQLIKLLLEKGADLAATDGKSNRKSLQWAVSSRDEALVQLLLQHESCNAARKNAMLYLTRLYRAIREKNEEALDQLLCDEQVQGLGGITLLTQKKIAAHLMNIKSKSGPLSKSSRCNIEKA